MAALPVKKRCVNCEEFTYTGKESSPLGLGYSSMACDLGTKMMGRDETMWMVSMKNNIKVWVRIPTSFAEEASTSVCTPVKKKATKKKETEPALQPEKVEEETPVPTPTKKKAVTKKPKAEEAKEDPPAPTPKKKAATKKTTTDASAPAPTRTPNKYNLYMKVRLAKLKEEYPQMLHTERLSKAASEWRTMTEEEKDKLIAELKE